MKIFQSKTENLLYSFIIDVGFPLNKAPTALDLSPSDFLNWWSKNSSKKLISQNNIKSISQYLNIDENTIYQKNYDKNLIRNRIYKNPLEIPDEYSANSFSYLRSSSHIVKYLTLVKGQHYTDNLLRKLNLSPLIYNNLDNKINIKYFIDLLDMLKQHGLTQEDLDSIASLILLGVKGSKLHEEFLKAKTYYDCFSAFASTINQLESNFEYFFDLTKESFRITTYLHFDKHTGLGKNTSLDKLIRYRTLCLSWFPRLCGLNPILPSKSEIIKTNNFLKETHTIRFENEKPNQPALIIVH